MTAPTYPGPIAERSVNMTVRDLSRSHRVKAFLSLRGGLALGCSLLVVVVIASQLCQFGSASRLDTRGMSLSDFIEQLRQRGVQLHGIPAAKHGTLFEGAYLTEDAAATWESMQHKRRAAAYIHEWHGTIWLGRALCPLDAEGLLAQWGEYGCRVGDFILFGDRRLLERIQEACR
jgi:hypothetical protein